MRTTTLVLLVVTALAAFAGAAEAPAVALDDQHCVLGLPCPDPTCAIGGCAFGATHVLLRLAGLA